MFGRSALAPRGIRRARVGLALVALVGAGLGCGDEKLGLDARPRIVSFAADPPRIQAGESTTLRWDIVGARGATIEPTVGLVAATGSARVRPIATTRYVLRVRTTTGETLEANATVEVVGGVPEIATFEATPLAVRPGEPTTLSWRVAYVDQVTLEPGLGTQPAEGSIVVRPEASTTYVLAARSSIGQARAELTVEVASGGQPLVRSFTASALSVPRGERVTLRWETADATQVVISPGVGAQSPTGSVEVTPTETTIYTLVAEGPGGRASASLTVAVTAAGDPEIVAFDVVPTTIVPGGRATLRWETNDASSVVLEPGLGAQPAKSEVEVSPAATTTYVLTALGSGREVRREVTLTVAAPDAVVVRSFAASPQAILRGGATTLTWATENAARVEIDNGVGANLGASGSVSVTPTQDTRYVLTAWDARGQSASAVVDVRVSAPPPVVTRFAAQPAAITAGQRARLEWTSTDATEVELDQGLGVRGPNDALEVSPSVTTTYRLTARGPGGTTTAQLTLNVSPAGAPTIGGFTASPAQITPGSQATLGWSTTDATEVRIDNGVGVVAASGNVAVTPPVTTTYTLTASGPGGTATARTTVTVAAPTGDRCTSPLVVAGSGTFTGDTRTAVDDVRDVSRCTGFTQAGPDQVYQVALQAGDRLRATVTTPGTPWDVSLYLLSSCSSPAQSCVAGEDNGTPEIVDYVATSAGNYLLVVDGFSATGGGAYVLEVELNPAPVPNDQCLGAYDVGPGGTFTGTTRGATNHYDPTSAGCTRFSANGPDVVFSVDLAAGERLLAEVDAPWDASLYVLRDCAQPRTSCLGGSDAGNPERVDLTAPATATYFIVIDGFGSNQGDFALTVVVSPPAASGGDTCATAIAVPAGGGVFSSTTQGLANDLDPGPSCTGYPAAGPDRVYRVDLGAGDVVEAVATFESTLDGALYAVTGCTPIAGCGGSDLGLAGQPEGLRLVADAAGPRYVVVDAERAGASGTHELRVTTWTGETCTAAPPLRLGNRPERTLTTGKRNDYSPNVTTCTGASASGEDRAYAVSLRAGDQLRATLTPDAPWDAALYLVSACSNVGASCVGGSDVRGAGAETIAPVVEQAGTYYLIVDGFSGSDGRGTLTATVARGDTCRDPYVVPSTGGTFRGTTVGYGADLGATVAAGSCTTFAQVGSDAVYRVTVGPGQTLDASVAASWDVALYLVSSCTASATTCRVGSDRGEPESLTYRNAGATPETLFLVVDSWRVGAAYTGAYTLSVTLR